jgi:hypothetical protein
MPSFAWTASACKAVPVLTHHLRMFSPARPEVAAADAVEALAWVISMHP